MFVQSNLRPSVVFKERSRVAASTFFVRKSALFHLLGTHLQYTTASAINSLILKKRVAMCRLAWLMDLFNAALIVALLSSCIVVGCNCGVCKSTRRPRRYTASKEPLVSAMSSDSKLDMATTGCFFDIHATGPPFSMKIEPLCDRRVSTQDA